MKVRRITKTCEGVGMTPTGDAQCPYCNLVVWEEDLRRDGTIRPHGTWAFQAEEKSPGPFDSLPPISDEQRTREAMGVYDPVYPELNDGTGAATTE